MSICNIWLNEHRAIVLTDTNTMDFTPGRAPTPGTMQKLIQHGDCVIAGRGALGAFYNVDLLMRQDPILSIDALQPRFEKLCELGTSMADSVRGGRLRHAHAEGEEVYAVGWSNRLGAMVAMVATRQEGESKFTTESIPHSCAAPGVWSVEDMPDLSTLGGMVAAAKEQVRVFHERFPGAPIGGDLVVAEISPTSIITHTITGW